MSWCKWWGCAALVWSALLPSAGAHGLPLEQGQQLEKRFQALADTMVGWRRDLHAYPELSGYEVRTSRLVAEHLRGLGLEVRTGIGGHGVVGILQGARPGKTVALRADMDALPVQEATGLPFASRVVVPYRGQQTAVMHACGHDGHTAILMGVATVLASMKDQLRGEIRFVFQPAEEGLPEGDLKVSSWGAAAMIEQGALKGVDAIYGLHLTANLPLGVVGYRSGPMMAGSDSFQIRIKGRGTHGSAPWTGVDPIAVAGQVIVGLQQLVSRQLDITREPAVISLGSVQAGNRDNVIPDTVDMLGTLRTFDEQMREDAKERMEKTVKHIAAASGAEGTLRFGPTAYSVTSNPAALTTLAVPVLRQAMGGQVMLIPKISGSEDFAEYQKVVPGFFFLLGATPAGKLPADAAPNHSAAFDFNEDAMPIGAKALAWLALDFLLQP